MSTGKPVLTPSGYLAGFDARAYLNGSGRFMELTAGLENTCYAYSVALSLPANADDGPPFYVSGCRYPGWVSNLKTFNRKTMKFEYAGYEIVERLSVSLGSAVGHYKGRRAAFVTYLKNTPGAYKPNVTGDGISIYYLDGETWKRKRVLKRIGDRATSQAIAVGDLNGDGLDDIVFADNLLNKLRIFFQTPGGEFEELDPSLEPSFMIAPSSIRIADVVGDGRPDIVLMTHYLTEHTTKGGGLRFFRNLPAK